MTAAVEVVVLQQSQVVEQVAGAVGVRGRGWARIDLCEKFVVFGIENSPELGGCFTYCRVRGVFVEAIVPGMPERTLQQPQEVTRMASATIDEILGNAWIEQACRCPLMENFAQCVEARLVSRTIGVCDLYHRQLEDMIEVLTSGGAFVDEVDWRAVDEQSTYLPELVHVGNEEGLCIVAAQKVGTVDHEENPMASAIFANGICGGIDGVKISN